MMVQSHAGQQASDKYCIYDQRLNALLRAHIRVLAWWSGANVLLGIGGLLLARGVWWYGSMMGLSWGLVNALVAWRLARHVGERRYEQKDMAWRRWVQRHVEYMLLLNVLLDSAYVWAGWYCLQLSKLTGAAHPELWQGFGYAVLLQGAYLLLHDLLFLRRHWRNRI